jgi:hypothetical protein
MGEAKKVPVTRLRCRRSDDDFDRRVPRRATPYSLCAGDVGTALFAAACLDQDARYPILDTF